MSRSSVTSRGGKSVIRGGLTRVDDMASYRGAEAAVRKKGPGGPRNNPAESTGGENKFTGVKLSSRKFKVVWSYIFRSCRGGVWLKAPMVRHHRRGRHGS